MGSGAFPAKERDQFENIVGFLPMFPISNNESNQTATLMGGWELNISRIFYAERPCVGINYNIGRTSHF